MSDLPTSARAVVIGAGIVGNSICYHLSELGWRDLVLLDKGPFPNPGGSTGHASNFIFPVDHSKEMTALTLDSVRQYQDLDVFTESGGIEVARTEERMQELHRRMSSAHAWGIDRVSMVTPAEIKELVPFIDETILLGGFSSPGVGVVDSLRAGTIMRERAVAAGALTISANTEVLGIDVERGRVRRVRTTRGDIETEIVVVACGVWSPAIAQMAGALIPLTPAVHQMIDIGPVPRFASSTRHIEYPIVRDMDTFMYERQDGIGLEIGSYAHRPILHDPEEIPSIEQAALSPTELPFTQADFDKQMEDALELMPEIVGDESVGVKYAINGLLSLTPDGMPLLGETHEVRGLWSCAAVWVKEGPGIAKAVAEWMTHGESEIDLHSSDIARFWEHQKTRAHVRARTSEGFNKTYGIIHPSEQWASNRDVRLPPFHARQQAAGRRLLRGRGLGAAALVRVERAAAGGVRRPHQPARGRVGRALVVADHQRRAPGDARPRRHGRPVRLHHLRCRRPGRARGGAGRGGAADGRAGRPRRLHAGADAGRRLQAPTSRSCGSTTSCSASSPVAPTGAADRKWFADRLPQDGTAQIADLTSAWTTLGLWGPRARDILRSVTRDDVSHEGFRFGSCRTIEIDTLRVLASRISYVGDLGWELYVPIEQGQKLWDVIAEAGRPHGIAPVGIGVYGTTGRLEKCYRAYGFELESEYNVCEAGMAGPKVKDEDFVGKQAHLRHRDEQPAAIMCTLTVDDHTSASGVKRYMLGREPIQTRDGQPLTDSRGRRSYVTSAGAGPSVGKHLLMAYLPPEQAQVGTELAVEYLNERYPVTVAVAGSTPIFDPENERIRS